MADNITETVSLSIVNPDGATLLINEHSNIKFDQDATYKSILKNTQEVTSSYAAIVLGSVALANQTVIWVFNKHASSILYVSRDGGTTDHDAVYPGEFIKMQIKPSGTAPQMKLSTGTGDAVVVAYEKTQA